MWDCTRCGTGRIAASLTSCPVCRKERDMPRTTSAGTTNASALPGETGYVAPDQEPQAAPATAADAPATAEVAAPVPPKPAPTPLLHCPPSPAGDG